MNDSNNIENDLSPVKKDYNASTPETSTANEVSKPVPEAAPVTEVSEPVPEVAPVTEVSEPVPKDAPVTEVSEPVPEVAPVTEVSEPVPEAAPVTEVSKPVPEAAPVTEVSEPVPEVAPVTEVSEPVPEVASTTVVPELTPVTPEVGEKVTPTDSISPIVVAPPTPQVELATPVTLTSTPVTTNPETEKIGVASDEAPTPASDSQENTIVVDDEELLKAFIGNNYDKITTRSFNLAGFFFSTLYMFYRKMFGYAILVFLVQILVTSFSKIYALSLIFNVIVGLFVNKIYLSFAKKKIANIKNNNAGKSIEELKTICASKGGTSVGQVILGLLPQFVIAFAVLFMMVLIGVESFLSEFINLSTTSGGDRNTTITGDKVLVENVRITGSMCIASCNYTISDANDETENYEFNASNEDLFDKLDLYDDYIKLDIYYVKNGSAKTIVDYKISLKSTNEDISDITTEKELREKIGLFTAGTNTASLTYKQYNGAGFGSNAEGDYSYFNYIFVDSNNIEYDMMYIGSNLNLVEGQNYNVTFEVREGTFDYEYVIQSVN